MDLSGLGGALGAAAGGYLTGRNRGEAELYRRGRLEADREQKQAALDAAAEARRQGLLMQQEGLDLRREGLANQKEGLALRGKPRPADVEGESRKLVGQIWLKNLEKRRDLENQGFFNDPKNEPVARQYDMANEHAEGIATGRIPLSELNWQLLSFAAGGPQQSGPVSVAPPNEPFLVDLGGGRAAMPPDFPVQQPGVGAGSTFVPSAPGAAPRQFVTAKQEQAGRRADVQERGVGVRERALELNTPYLQGRGAIAKSDAGVRPELNRQKVVGGVARIENTRATTKQTKALTPINVAKGKESIATSKKNRELGERRTATGERSQAEQARANKERERLSREKQADLKAYRGVLIDKAKKALATKGNTEEARLLQQRVNTNLRIYTALGGKDAAGRQLPVYDAARRDRAQAEMEEALGRLTEIRRGETAKATKPAVATAAPRKGGITKMFGGRAYSWKEFYSEGKQHGKKDGDLKAHWATLPGAK